MSAFTARKQVAIAALLMSRSLAQAAKNCHVSERTLRRWLADPMFAQRYQAERSRLLESAVNVLRQEATSAARTLAGVSNDKKAPTAQRVAAARSVLDLVLRAHELQEIEARLLELEKVAGKR